MVKLVPSRTAKGPMKVSRVIMPPCEPRLDGRVAPVLRLPLLLLGMGRLQLFSVTFFMPFRVMLAHTGRECPSLFA